jgi:GGDEF domain-containing protein
MSGDNEFVTLSIGVATHPAGRYESPHDFADDLMARADLAMYRSKQAGGNRVTASDNALNSADKLAEAV